MQQNNIKYHPFETVIELLQKAEQYKSVVKMEFYELDQLALERGHEIIRLTPYHCQCDPIKLMWAIVKGEVAAKNKTFHLLDVEHLMHEALDRVTIVDWASHIAHTERLQEDDYHKEVTRDSVINNLIINLEDSDSDETDEFGAEDEEEDNKEVLTTPL